MRGVSVLAAVAVAIGCAASPPATPVTATPAPAPTAPAPEPAAEQPVPPDLASDVAASERVGQLLFAHDTAAALASDAVLAHFAKDPPRIGGWLALRAMDPQGQPAPAFFVFFFSLETPWRVLVRARVPMVPGGRAEVEELVPPAAPDARMEAFIRGRQLALALPSVAKDRRWNPVVLPAEVVGHKGLLVYLLQAPAERELVMGIHRRVLVSDDGRRVLADQPLSKSELRIPLEADGEKIAAAWSTHAQSDTPTEIHVMLSRQHDRPLFIATRRGAWRVEAGRIHFLGAEPGGVPAAPSSRGALEDHLGIAKARDEPTHRRAVGVDHE